MAYDIILPLPDPFKKEMDSYVDESGVEVTHFEAHCPSPDGKSDTAMIDIYVGDMHEDTTAQDQALSNYADIVGFDDDDPEDFEPIRKIKFNSKNAYAFDALCEDDSPMTFISQEIKSGVLAIICAAAKDEKNLEELLVLLERNLRVR